MARRNRIFKPVALLLLVALFRSTREEARLYATVERCFHDPGHRHRCCSTAEDDAKGCFDEVFGREECCGRGFAIVQPESPPEPLRFCEAGDRRCGPVAAETERQQMREDMFAPASVTHSVELGGVPFSWRYFKLDKYTTGVMLDALAEDEYGLLSHRLAAGEVALDVGANVGGVSVFLGRLQPQARVIALEPDPTIFRYLLWNLKRNGVADKVWPLNAGICPPGQNATYAVLNPTGFLRRATHSVPCLSLAELFAAFGLQRVALLKIDCEGCEYGMFSPHTADAMLRRVDRIAGELHVPGPGVGRAQVRLTRRILCRRRNWVEGCKEPAVPIPL